MAQALPLLEAQTPDDILVAGVQSLPVPSETPETTGVCLLLLAGTWPSLLINSQGHSRRS